MKQALIFLAVCSAGACACAADVSDDPEPRPVTQTIRLLEAGNISRHWYTWLRSQRARDGGILFHSTGPDGVYGNGMKVGEYHDLRPSGGRFQLQSEGFGIDYRNIVLEPLKK